MKITTQETASRSLPLLAVTLVGAAWSVAALFAGDASAQPGRDERRGPPPEALAACESLASGDNCEFSGPKGDVEGACVAPNQEMPLACRPKRPPPPDRAASGPKR